mmetsp:Transcript_3321/g.7561  ORF Transcript_3321/g.7561 Transcript_3321/m.7561 type:complete len:274 (+) Transcript_3321:987-1808(+)
MLALVFLELQLPLALRRPLPRILADLGGSHRLPRLHNLLRAPQMPLEAVADDGLVENLELLEGLALARGRPLEEARVVHRLPLAHLAPHPHDLLAVRVALLQAPEAQRVLHDCWSLEFLLLILLLVELRLGIFYIGGLPAVRGRAPDAIPASELSPATDSWQATALRHRPRAPAWPRRGFFLFLDPLSVGLLRLERTTSLPPREECILGREHLFGHSTLRQPLSSFSSSPAKPQLPVLLPLRETTGFLSFLLFGPRMLLLGAITLLVGRAGLL